MLSRLGFAEEPQIIQDLGQPLDIPFQTFGSDEGGHLRIRKLSRPILKVRVPVHGAVITVFNCHLKSKLGEYIRPDEADFAPEADLTNYDPIGRALGSARAALRRMAEAWVLRGAIALASTSRNSSTDASTPGPVGAKKRMPAPSGAGSAMPRFGGISG